MLCSACQTPIAEGAKFCPKCGVRAGVPAAETGGKRCPQCGTENQANTKFCKKDGYRFDSVTDEPDMVATPTAPAPAMQAPREPIAPEVASNKISPADNSVICPKCGTPNLLGAKFCKKDGYALQAGVARPRETPVSQESSTPAKTSKPRKGLVIGALVGVVLLASAGGGYAYWAGHIGNRQGDVQAKINTELDSRGLNAVRVTIDREWNASLSGTVQNQAEKDRVLEVMRGHKELKGIATETIQVLSRAADLENGLNKTLADSGLGAITAQVDKELVATLKGVVESLDQKTQAFSVASGVAGLKSVKDDVQVAVVEFAPPPPEIELPAPLPQQPAASMPRPAVKLGPPQAPTPQPQATAIDPAKLEGDLNRILRNQNVRGVTAQVGDDLSVTLKGSGSASEKERALQVARQFRGVRTVKDKIFAVE